MQYTKSPLINVLVILFIIIEMSAYFLIKEQVEVSIQNEIRQHYIDIESNVNVLMGYNEKITTGKLDGYAPGAVPMDLEWFKGYNWTEYPDSTIWQARNKNFIATYCEDKLIGTSEYAKIKELECLYTISYFSTVWELECLRKSASSLFLYHIYPYAWGYKKCNAYEKQFRPTGYNACKDVFEYLTENDERYATYFTNESNKVDAILNLENKYYYIKRIDNDRRIMEEEENRQRRMNKEREIYTSSNRFDYIHNYYYGVFCEIEFPEIEYRISPKESYIKKETNNRILNNFLIISTITLLILFIIYYGVKNMQKGNAQ